MELFAEPWGENEEKQVLMTPVIFLGHFPQNISQESRVGKIYSLALISGPKFLKMSDSGLFFLKCLNLVSMICLYETSNCHFDIISDYNAWNSTNLYIYLKLKNIFFLWMSSCKYRLSFLRKIEIFMLRLTSFLLFIQQWWIIEWAQQHH